MSNLKLVMEGRKESVSQHGPHGVAPPMEQLPASKLWRDSSVKASVAAKTLEKQALARHGARFPTEIYTRGCQWNPTPARLKRTCG